MRLRLPAPASVASPVPTTTPSMQRLLDVAQADVRRRRPSGARTRRCRSRRSSTCARAGAATQGTRALHGVQVRCDVEAVRGEEEQRRRGSSSTRPTTTSVAAALPRLRADRAREEVRDVLRAEAEGAGLDEPADRRRAPPGSGPGSSITGGASCGCSTGRSGEGLPAKDIHHMRPV